MSNSDRPDSPCIGVCSTLFGPVCIGCGRTVDEVSQWVGMTPEQREVVWLRIEADGTSIRQKRLS